MNQNQARRAAEPPLSPPPTENRWLRARRIRLHLALVLAVVAALLPVTILSVVQSISAHQAMNHMVGERLVASASMTALEQRDPLMMARRVLETMAEDERLLGADTACNARLEGRLKGRMPIINFERWNATGALICSAVEAPPFTARAAGTGWWRDVTQSQHFIITPPVIDQQAFRRVLIAALPLSDGEVFGGALTADIDLSWMERSLAQRQLSSRAVVGIADGDGNLLIASRPTGFTKIDLAASNGRAAVAAGTNGPPWLYASAPLHGRHLYVFYAEPENMAFSLSREQFRAGLALPVGALILSCFAVWLAMDRYVLRWLRRAGSRTRLLAQGDYRLHPDDFAEAPLELRRLGRNLDDMAAAIAERDLALRRALADKDAMAREVNHRVKNNLQMIASLVSLQAARLDDVMAKRLLTQMRLRVDALALVHRLIYDLDGSERGLVDTSRLFTELCAQLETGFRPSRVRFKCRSDAGSISGDQAVAAALIVVEAVTNAYRHGFPEDRDGRIDVLLTGEDGKGVLTISDDGVGRDAQAASPGMGQDLMRALTEQLGGALDLSDTPGGGRTVTVSFSLAHIVLA